MITLLKSFEKLIKVDNYVYMIGDWISMINTKGRESVHSNI